MSDVEEIKARFLAGCEKRFREIYGFLKGKKVWIYGSGMYGRFLSKALVDYGCVEQTDIQAFINDFESGFEVDGISVVKLEDCSFPAPDRYCVVVGIGNDYAVNLKLEERRISHFALTATQQALSSLPLFYARYGQPAWTLVGDVLGRIGRYYELGLQYKREEMTRFYEDEESVSVLETRLAFYETGRSELLEQCPIRREEYFAEGLISVGKDETYVDLGTYTGDSMLSFVAYTKGQYRKIMAFEPDRENFQVLKSSTAGLANVELVEAATGNRNGEIMFSDGHGLGSAISETGTKKVRLVRLDDFMKEPPTLVKMDIEGAELDTLKGMERIIKKHRPKLIVCVYHKVEDLYEIPKYLKELVPEYRFKLRQHEASIYETVLYAEV